jgi:hypothetical protein
LDLKLKMVEEAAKLDSLSEQVYDYAVNVAQVEREKSIFRLIVDKPREWWRNRKWSLQDIILDVLGSLESAGVTGAGPIGEFKAMVRNILKRE